MTRKPITLLLGVLGVILVLATALLIGIWRQNIGLSVLIGAGVYGLVVANGQKPTIFML